MNGRDWIRRNSITSAGPAITPPHEASDFENVAIRRSTSVLDAEQLGGARAARAEHAERVRLVDHQPRAEPCGTARRSRAAAPRRPPSRTRRRRRPARRRHRRRPSRACARGGPCGCDETACSFARERMQPSRIEAWSPESAIDRVARAEDRPQRAEVGLVAGGEHQRGLGVQPLGELALELEVEIDRPVEEARAGQPGAVAVERIQRALLDPLVAGQPQVVVGAEHDPPLALHLHDRQRRALQHAEVGQRIELPGGPQLLQALVLTRLGEDVDRGRHSPPWLYRNGTTRAAEENDDRARCHDVAMPMSARAQHTQRRASLEDRRRGDRRRPARAGRGPDDRARLAGLAAGRPGRRGGRHRVRRRRRHARAGQAPQRPQARPRPQRPRRAVEMLPIVGSRTFLVDVHLVGKPGE